MSRAIDPTSDHRERDEAGQADDEDKALPSLTQDDLALSHIIGGMVQGRSRIICHRLPDNRFVRSLGVGSCRDQLPHRRARTAGNASVSLPQDGATVDLGLGNDSMSVSGNGGDRIIFAKGDGHDTLNNPGGGSGIEQGVGSFRFIDGTSWDRNDILNVLAGGGHDLSTPGNDTINGNGGDDTIYGDAGNDALNGDSGTDIAAFAGGQADYSIVTSNGTATVADNAPTVDGDDGTDTLVNIETLQFKDGSTSLASPIVLDLDGDGVHLTDKADSTARFDWKGDGGWCTKLRMQRRHGRRLFRAQSRS